MTKKDRWILSEFLVARDLCSRGARLLEHQFETPYAEVDLVLEQSSGRTLVIVEVKSFDGDLWSRELLTRRQRLRLTRARAWLEARSRQEVRLGLAVVSYLGRIRYFQL